MESDPNSTICPICNNPIGDNSKGSLTQWIVQCTCDSRNLEKSIDLELEASICSKCGKKIGQTRQGSLSQWIFGRDCCNCPIKENQTEDNIQPAFYAEPLTELDISDSVFPKERYKPVSVLGSGAEGTVYLAEDRLLNTTVAVKTLHQLSPEQITRFQKEARAISQLNHPSIVRLLDFGVTNESIPFMVLTYSGGEPLRNWLDSKNALTPQNIVKIFLQITEALSYAHKKNIFHQDLNPSNIILTKEDNDVFKVTLIDFHIVAAKTESNKLEWGELVCAPAYMPPDTVAGLQYDQVSEVYSLGCILYECLAGHPPFEGETILETIRMHSEDSPKPISNLEEDGDYQYLEELVFKVLEKEKEARYQTMEEVKKALLNIDIQDEIESQLETTKVKPLPFKLLIPVIAVCLLASVVYLTKNEKIAHKETIKKKPSIIAKQEEPKESSFTFQTENRELTCRATGKVKDKDIIELSKNKKINILILDGTEVTGHTLDRFRKSNLYILRLKQSKLNDKGAASIASLKSLTALDIRNCDNLTNNGLAQFKKLPNLLNLRIGSKNISIESFKIVKQIKSLNALFLYVDKNSNFGSFGSELASGPKLKAVIFERCPNISPKIVRELKHVTTLTSISFIRSPFTKQVATELTNTSIYTLVLRGVTRWEPGAVMKLATKKGKLSVNVYRGDFWNNKTPIKELQVLRQKRPDFTVSIKN